VFIIIIIIIIIIKSLYKLSWFINSNLQEESHQQRNVINKEIGLTLTPTVYTTGFGDDSTQIITKL